MRPPKRSSRERYTNTYRELFVRAEFQVFQILPAIRRSGASLDRLDAAWQAAKTELNQQTTRELAAAITEIAVPFGHPEEDHHPWLRITTDVPPGRAPPPPAITRYPNWKGNPVEPTKAHIAWRQHRGQTNPWRYSGLATASSSSRNKNSSSHGPEPASSTN